MTFERLRAALHTRARRGSGVGSRRSEAALARWLRRAVLAIGVAGLLVLPQFVSNASFLGVRGLPGPLVVLLVGFAFWLMPVLLVASWAAEGRAAISRPWLAIPAGLFIAGAVVSTVFAADKSSAMVRAAELAGLWVGMFALAQVLRTDAERRLAVAALVAACLVAGCTAIYQAAYDLPRTWEYFQEHRAEVLAQFGIEPGGWGEQMFIGRFTGGVQATLGHPNVLAAFLTLGLFAALGLAREKWSEAASRGARAMAAMVAGAAVVCGVGIVLAQARAAMVSVGVGVYWLAVAWWVGRPRRRRILYAAPLVLGAAGLAVAAVVNHPATAGALASLKVRLDYWQATAEILRRHGATGVGLENFALHYLQFKLPTAPEEVADPHNFFLSTWSVLGLAGLAALVSVWVIAIRAWLRRGAEAGPGRGEPSGAPGGMPAASFPRACSPPSADACPRNGGMGMPPASEAGGEPLAGLLAPVLVLAAPAVVYFSVTGQGGDWKSGVVLGMIGAGVAAVMILAMGVAAAEEPSRLAVAGRPFRSLRSACVVGLLAFALQEQIGTAVLEPPTAWAMLVLLAVTLSTRDATPARRGFFRRQLVAEGGSGGRLEHPDEARPEETGPGAPGVKLGVALKSLLMAAAMIAAFLYVSRLVLPVGREAYLLRLAVNPMTTAERDETLRAAAAANPLAWEPAMMRGHAWQEEAGLARGPGDAMALAHAVAGYQDALAREPRLRRACLALAGCNLAAEGALDNPSALGEARRSLDRAVALYPTDLVARLWLAHVIDRLGDREAALAAYREVLRLDGLMPEPKRRLPSEVRTAAEGRVKELAEGSPGPPYAGDLPIRLYLAMQMERLGCTAAAYWAYREVLDLDSRLAEPRRLSADVRRAVETRLGQLAGAMTGASPGPEK